MEDYENPCVQVEGQNPDRRVTATRNIGMGEVILSRERPFAACLSGDEGAYQVQLFLMLFAPFMLS